jgi:spore coat protein U-like protein
MLKIARLALIAAALGASSAAFALQESANITVNATVPGVCKLTSSAAVTVTINANPSTGGAATGTAPVTFKCTKSKGYTFSVSQGATSSSTGTLAGSLSDGATTPTTVPFTATWTQPSGTGAGFSAANEVTADVLVTITQANYQDAPAGTYSGNMTVKIDY